MSDLELSDSSVIPVTAESIAMAEVIAYKEDVRSANVDCPTVFTLSKLCELYSQQINRHTGSSVETAGGLYSIVL